MQVRESIDVFSCLLIVYLFIFLVFRNIFSCWGIQKQVSRSGVHWQCVRSSTTGLSQVSIDSVNITMLMMSSLNWSLELITGGRTADTNTRD